MAEDHPLLKELGMSRADVRRALGTTRKKVLNHVGPFSLGPDTRKSGEVYLAFRDMLRQLLKFAEKGYGPGEQGAFNFTRFACEQGIDGARARWFMYDRLGSLYPEVRNLRRFIDAADKRYGYSDGKGG